MVYFHICNNELYISMPLYGFIFTFYTIYQTNLNYASPRFLCQFMQKYKILLLFINFKIMWKNNNLRKVNKLRISRRSFDRGSIYFKPLHLSQFSVIRFMCMNPLNLYNNNNNNNIVLDLIPCFQKFEPRSR